jgi:hypothetical protein
VGTTTVASRNGFSWLKAHLAATIRRRNDAPEHSMSQPPLFGDMPQRKPLLFELPNGETITDHQLSRADRETQLDVMKHWFFANFADPVEETPYDSAEGGYQFIYGGPYEPREELENKFYGVIPDELIEELSTELESRSYEWTGHSKDFRDEEDDLVDSVATAPKYVETFHEAMRNIRRFAALQLDPDQLQHLRRLLFVNVISALETYLLDNFVTQVNSDEAKLRKFVETTPAFKQQKIQLSEVFQVREEIQQRANTFLLGMVWHRLDQAKQMFRDTLSVDFPNDTTELSAGILVRHDLVHRNGKTKDGVDHNLTEQDVEKRKRLV